MPWPGHYDGTEDQESCRFSRGSVTAETEQSSHREVSDDQTAVEIGQDADLTRLVGPLQSAMPDDLSARRRPGLAQGLATPEP